MLRSLSVGLIVAVLAMQDQPSEPDGPCGWSARWHENHTTKPVELDKTIELKKIEDALIAWPESDVGHGGAPSLEYIISPGGKVEEVRFAREPVFHPPWPEADRAILEAIYQWEYEPVVIDGVSVPVCVVMTININWS